jgi:glycerol-3-phosphate acyltransferase PlsY
MILGLLVFPLAFLIGAIPTGYLLVKAFRGRDVRRQGSGNIGTTNVIRTEGWVLGILVLLADAGKAWACVYLFSLLFEQQDLLRLFLGITVIVGNIFTPFLRFRGGKGVGSGLGVAIAISPLAAVIAVCCFGLTVLTTRYVSLGSLAAAVVYAAATFLFYLYADTGLFAFVFSAILMVAIFLRHTANISRLIHGQENRIAFKENGA